MEKAPKLTWLERDALREIASIGAGNATTALSKLVKRRIDVIVPRLSLVELRSIPEIMGGPEKMATAMFSRITGDTFGSLVVLFERENSYLVVDILKGNALGTTKTLTPDDLKSLEEMGVILSRTCLVALTDFLGLNLEVSEPGVASDMVKSLMDTVLTEFAVKSDHALLIKVEFASSPVKVGGHFALIFDVTTIDRIIDAIHEKLGDKRTG